MTLAYTAKDLAARCGLPLEDCRQLAEPDDECYLVQAIKQHLRTPEQKAWLNTNDLSIEDVLNGRYGETTEQGVLQIFDAWNAKLNAPGLFGD